MDNLNLPAYPIFDWHQLDDGQIVIKTTSEGFTKLEKAALMIAQGMVVGAWSDGISKLQTSFVAHAAVTIAKEVLEEANK